MEVASLCTVVAPASSLKDHLALLKNSTHTKKLGSNTRERLIIGGGGTMTLASMNEEIKCNYVRLNKNKPMR